jgi:hypothetical protein
MILNTDKNVMPKQVETSLFRKNKQVEGTPKNEETINIGGGFFGQKKCIVSYSSKRRVPCK